MVFLWNFLDLWILVNDCLHFYLMKSSRIPNKQFWWWHSKMHKPWSFSSLGFDLLEVFEINEIFLKYFSKVIRKRIYVRTLFNTILYASIDDSLAMCVFSEKLFSQTKSKICQLPYITWLSCYFDALVTNMRRFLSNCWALHSVVLVGIFSS